MERRRRKMNTTTADVLDLIHDQNIDIDKLYDILHDFKEFTTAHGIPHVVHAKGKPRTIFWTIISLIAVGGFCYNAYKNMETFLGYPVSVSVSIQSQRTVTFPAVTLCNHNSVLQRKLDSTLSLKTLSNAFASVRKKRSIADTEDPAVVRRRRAAGAPAPQGGAGGGPSFGGTVKDGRALDQRYEFQKKVTETISDMSLSEKINLGHTIDNLILSCNYNGYDCNMTTDFYSFYDATYGNCYAFNWGRNNDETFTSYIPGATHGLSIIFNVEQSEYVGYLTEAAGMRVVVHPQDSMPFPADDGVSAAPGQLTYIGVKKLQLERIGTPWGSCTTSDAATNNLRNVHSEIHGVGYTTKGCYKTCYQAHMIANCKCADSSYPMHGIAYGNVNVSTCKSSNTTEATCQEDTYNKYNSNSLGCTCHEPCDETAFLTSVSNVMWPSDHYKQDLFVLVSKHPVPAIGQVIMSNDTNEYKRNFGKIVVFFEEFNYESISESEAYTLFSLISDFGGILGLFIGFSLMTIIEFLELAFNLFMTTIEICMKRLSKQAVNPETSVSTVRNPTF